ncbi:outer membrane beta-barrel protein [Stakelama tenebrarum]|uniref:Outer membrane beta-barrel protein n=1 Tax=Stakelama tenebrarum TaxID=2711215 RepID=A0A6G6Y3L8_9SPHN|nr:outer membrane beta-barrel protein [Sphingosinithalassobacter tenebrarum]QIG79522.1 outer membrane beta-barrel protein [Sphingosinithalassobacter tenebrarum]
MTASAAPAARAGLGSLLLISIFAVSAPASAQVGGSLLLNPVEPEGFDIDEEVSVAQRARPEYDARGVRVRSFIVFPWAQIGVGTKQDPRPTALATANARISANSNWSRHSLRLAADVRTEQYTNSARPSANSWEVGLDGRYDIGSSAYINGTVNSALRAEDRFFGSVTAENIVISNYRNDSILLRGVYSSGRVRGMVTGDYQDYRFSPLELTDGRIRDQSFRDRRVYRVTGQFDYALSPSVALFTQVAYQDIDFDVDLVRSAGSIDSKGYRILGGASFQIPGLLNGTVGVGYSIRDYTLPQVSNETGVSAAARVNFFPSRRTTTAISVDRSLQDAPFGGADAYWSTLVGASIDHELRENVILTAWADYIWQAYVNSDNAADIYGGAVSGKYLISPNFELNATVSYRQRRSNVQQGGNDSASNFDDLTATVGFTFKL